MPVVTAEAIGTLLGPSGGLLWHWRALVGWRRHRSVRQQVAQWLEQWQPPVRHLIAVGMSGGWLLPNRFLQRFKHITIIDTDPSAKLVFTLLHGRRLRAAGVTVRWCRADFVTELPQQIANDAAAVLFCNVLGQLPLEREDAAPVLAALPAQLQRHHWASFHDRYSGNAVDLCKPPPEHLDTVSSLDSQALQRLGCRGEWADHGTGALLPLGVARRSFAWHLTAHRLHWLEAGTVRPMQPWAGAAP